MHWNLYICDAWQMGRMVMIDDYMKEWFALYFSDDIMMRLDGAGSMILIKDDDKGESISTLIAEERQILMVSQILVSYMLSVYRIARRDEVRASMCRFHFIEKETFTILFRDIYIEGRHWRCCYLPTLAQGHTTTFNAFEAGIYCISFTHDGAATLPA